MSALPPKADIRKVVAKRLLLTQSGHSATRAKKAQTRKGGIDRAQSETVISAQIDVADKGAVAGYCIVTVSTDKNTVHLDRSSGGVR